MPFNAEVLLTKPDSFAKFSITSPESDLLNSVVSKSLCFLIKQLIF